MAGTRKKVLWVDDEIEFLRSHIMFLETRGYSVTPVFSGDDAIQLITENPKGFDIILLDEQMPGKDGLTTLEEIKNFIPDLPVVMVTKSEEEQLMEDALGKKIDGYLTKPVNPSQILMVCKKILDSNRIISGQVSQRFIREFSANKAARANRLSSQDWIRMYENLTKWDFELDNVQDEGLRQTHAGQKSDCNAAFCDFIIDNYARWVKKQGDPPVLSVDIIDKAIAPYLRDNQQVFYIVCSGMRLDQYIVMEQALRTIFEIKRNYYYSILPSSTPFARNALFAGTFPSEIAKEFPDIWQTGDEPENIANKHEKELLDRKLKSLNINIECQYHNITNQTEALSPLPPENPGKAELHAIVINFFDLLSQSRATSSILQEIAPDEHAFRTLTQSWFLHSALYLTLKELSKRKCVIILTSDHGSVLCSRATEIYGMSDIGQNVRYKFGTDITADERRVLFIGDLNHFRLPKFQENCNCVIAKENFLFISPDKYESYRKQFPNSFQQGGISMEEMIVPLGIWKPL